MTRIEWAKQLTDSLKERVKRAPQTALNLLQTLRAFNQISKPIFAAGVMAGLGVVVILDSRMEIRRTFHKDLHTLISANPPILNANWYGGLSTGKQADSAAEAVRSVTRLFDDLVGAAPSRDQAPGEALGRVVSITQKDDRGRADKGAVSIQVVAVVTYEDFSRLLGRLERHDLNIDGMSLQPYGQGDEGKMFHRATFDLRVRTNGQAPSPQGAEAQAIPDNPFLSAFFDPLEVGGDNKYVPHTTESGFINNMLVKPGSHVRLNDRAKGRYVDVKVVDLRGDEVRLQSENGDRTYRIPASARKD
jgi:hypothetical protein